MFCKVETRVKFESANLLIEKKTQSQPPSLAGNINYDFNYDCGAVNILQPHHIFDFDEQKVSGSKADFVTNYAMVNLQLKLT